MEYKTQDEVNLNDEEGGNDLPSAEEAAVYICSQIGVAVSDIKWEKMKLTIQRSKEEDGPDVFRFGINTGTECSLTGMYSRRRSDGKFNHVAFTEFQPTEDPTAKWQKTFRIDDKGVVHLLVRKVLGESLVVGKEVLTFASDKQTVDFRGIRVPVGLANMPPDEKKQLLLHSIHASLIKNELMDKKPGVQPTGFPNVIEHENIPLLTPTV